jgi:hypothetical protein
VFPRPATTRTAAAPQPTPAKRVVTEALAAFTDRVSAAACVDACDGLEWASHQPHAGPTGNAVVEPLFATLKVELTPKHEPRSSAAVERA